MPRGTRNRLWVLVAAVLAWSSVAPAAAAAEHCTDTSCVEAQEPKRNKESDEGLLDKIGLGSLEDIPWSTLPLALALSALIGLAGGFVYSGLVGSPPREREKKAD